MKKYSPEPEALVPKLVKFNQEAIDKALSIHNNFSEFVRDALDDKIKKEQAILDSLN